MSEAVLKRAKELLEIEAQAISRCQERLGDSFVQTLGAIQEVLNKKAKLIFIGVGKSHYVARKLAASFMSTGVTAIFVHPSEAFHGDLGAIHEGDLVFLLSKSGRSAEILGLLPFFEGRNPIVAITGDLESPLAKKATYVLDASVEKEACPMNLLPTASTTVSLALGDALVACLAEESGFQKKDFATYHPGGSIGKRLNHYVKDVYHPKDKCASGSGTTPLKAVAKALNQYRLGIFAVLSDSGELEGIITDGDVRRLLADDTAPDTPASQVMNQRPTTLGLDVLIDNAIATLEQKERRINCAPVVDTNKQFLGLVHIHDLI